MGHHPLIVVGIDTDQLSLEVEGVLTVGLVAELVLVQVRPAPDLGIHHMGEALPSRHLQTPDRTDEGCNTRYGAQTTHLWVRRSAHICTISGLRAKRSSTGLQHTTQYLLTLIQLYVMCRVVDNTRQ